MITGDQGDVVFPDVQVFAIGPWSLVPDIGVTTRAPEQRWNRSADVSVLLRKYGRNRCCDLIFKRLTLRARANDDVVAGDGELEIVNHVRRQRIGQLNRKTVA